MKLEDTITVELVGRDRRCVCVGGCDEVAYKVEKLVRSGARVEVYAERSALSPRAARAIDDGLVMLVERAPKPDEIAGAAVVFVSPEEEALGASLAATARDNGTLVCTLDRPAASAFINPGSADVSGLRVTVASGGLAPPLGPGLAEEFEMVLGPPGLGHFVWEAAERREARPEARREKVAGFRLEGRLVFPAWWDEA